MGCNSSTMMLSWASNLSLRLGKHSCLNDLCCYHSLDTTLTRECAFTSREHHCLDSMLLLIMGVSLELQNKACHVWPLRSGSSSMWTYTCMHTYICTYIVTYIHTHTYVRTYAHPSIHTYIDAHTHTHTHTYIHAHEHTCLHLYLLICIYTYIYTYT